MTEELEADQILEEQWMQEVSTASSDVSPRAAAPEQPRSRLETWFPTFTAWARSVRAWHRSGGAGKSFTWCLTMVLGVIRFPSRVVQSAAEGWWIGWRDPSPPKPKLKPVPPPSPVPPAESETEVGDVVPFGTTRTIPPVPESLPPVYVRVTDDGRGYRLVLDDGVGSELANFLERRSAAAVQRLSADIERRNAEYRYAVKEEALRLAEQAAARAVEAAVPRLAERVSMLWYERLPQPVLNAVQVKLNEARRDLDAHMKQLRESFWNDVLVRVNECINNWGESGLAAKIAEGPAGAEGANHLRFFLGHSLSRIRTEGSMIVAQLNSNLTRLERDAEAISEKLKLISTEHPEFMQSAKPLEMAAIQELQDLFVKIESLPNMNTKLKLDIEGLVAGLGTIEHNLDEVRERVELVATSETRDAEELRLATKGLSEGAEQLRAKTEEHLAALRTKLDGLQEVMQRQDGELTSIHDRALFAVSEVSALERKLDARIEHVTGLIPPPVSSTSIVSSVPSMPVPSPRASPPPVPPPLVEENVGDTNASEEQRNVVSVPAVGAPLASSSVSSDGGVRLSSVTIEAPSGAQGVRMSSSPSDSGVTGAPAPEGLGGTVQEGGLREQPPPAPAREPPPAASRESAPERPAERRRVPDAARDFSRSRGGRILAGVLGFAVVALVVFFSYGKIKAWWQSEHEASLLRPAGVPGEEVQQEYQYNLVASPRSSVGVRVPDGKGGTYVRQASVGGNAAGPVTVRVRTKMGPDGKPMKQMDLFEGGIPEQ